MKRKIMSLLSGCIVLLAMSLIMVRCQKAAVGAKASAATDQTANQYLPWVYQLYAFQCPGSVNDRLI